MSKNKNPTNVGNEVLVYVSGSALLSEKKWNVFEWKLISVWM